MDIPASKQLSLPCYHFIFYFIAANFVDLAVMLPPHIYLRGFSDWKSDKEKYDLASLQFCNEPDSIMLSRGHQILTIGISGEICVEMVKWSLHLEVCTGIKVAS